MPDWRRLRVGDKIRIVAVRPYIQEEYGRTGDDFTFRVLKRLADRQTIRVIARIDEFGQPWFDYRFRNDAGEMEDHALAVCDDDSWVFVKPRKRAKH